MSRRHPSTVVLAPTATIRDSVWRHVCDLATGLTEQDVRVRLLLPSQANELADDAVRLGLERVAMREIGPGDLLHLHLADTYDRAATTRLLGARRRGAHTVITEHRPRTEASDPTILRAPTRMGSNKAKTTFKLSQYALAHRVITISEGSRRFLLERYPVEAGTLVTIVNGVRTTNHFANAADAAAPGWPGNETVDDAMRIAVPRFVAAGNISDQKGFDILVEAAYKAATDWTVDIYGEGPHRARLTARAARAVTSTGSQRLTFRGWTNQLEQSMNAATGVVMPSRWQCSGYTALDGMALSRPVVGSRVDGLEDIICSGVTGFLVTPGEPTELAAALDTLACTPVMARRMGLAASQRVAAKFRMDRMVSETLEVFHGVRQTVTTTRVGGRSW